MADSTIANLTAGTVAASDDIVFVQSGATKTDTVQGILDLTTSSNLATANLTADANRVYTLNGSLSSDTLTFEAGSNQDIMVFKGDNDIDIYSAANVKYATFDESTETFKASLLELGNTGTATQYAFTSYSLSSSTSGIARFYNSTSVSIFDFRQSGGHATFAMYNATGTNKVYFSVYQNYFSAGTRLFIGGTTGTSRQHTLTIHNTNGSITPITDGAVLCSYDQTAGNACIQAVSEGGDVVKLYTEAALTASDGTLANAVIRIGEIETALQNIGLLA